MDTTRATLIHRVRDAEDSTAWNEFYRLYSGVIYRYARERGLNDTDAMDVVGDCLESLSRRMREFDYDPQRCKFRNFLRTVVSNRVIAIIRKKKLRRADSAELSRLAAEEDSPDEVWEKQWNISQLLHCWAQIEKEISPLYAEAFRLCAIEGLPANKVAQRLEITPNHVHQIKVRMTQRLRDLMLAMIEEG